MNRLKYNWEQAWAKFKDIPRPQQVIIANYYGVTTGLGVVALVVLILLVTGNLT